MVLEEVLFLWQYLPGVWIISTCDQPYFCRLIGDSKFGHFVTWLAVYIFPWIARPYGCAGIISVGTLFCKPHGLSYLTGVWPFGQRFICVEEVRGA